MPTDELSFPEVFDAVRELRHDVDPPTGWHDTQRAALLTFIETGDMVVVRSERDVDDGDVITLDRGAGARPRHRLAVLVAVAAAVALLAAGLAVVPRWRGQEVPPATQPGSTDGVVPFPDRYPVLPAGHPMESRVTAVFDGQFDWSNEPRSWMIVGRLVDEVVVESIHISSTTMSPAEAAAELTGSPQGEPIDAVGEGWNLYRDVAFLSDVLVGRRGPATLMIAGADPVATLGAMGGLGFVDVSVDSAGEPFLGVTTVPDGYRVIFGPESRVPGAMSAALTIPDGEGTPDPTLPEPRGDEGDGITVRIDMNGPFLRHVDGLRRVKIGDVEGWVRTDPGSPVTWKVSDTTWATVWDAADTDTALEFARSLEFVDRATWVERYDVPAPQYPAGPPPGTPTATVAPATADVITYPDRFAVVPDDHPLAAQSSAMYGGMRPIDNVRMAEALVAVDDGSALRNGAALRAYAEVPDDMFPGAQPVELGGVSGRLWVEPGSPSTTTFITDGVPALAVQAADAAAFVDAAGGVPIVDVRFGTDGSLTFDIGPLPDGYTTIVPPGLLPRAARAVNALTRVPDGDNGDGISVWVEVVNPLTAYALYGDMERVEINGVVGWMRDRGPGSPVIWQVSDATWAMVAGAMRLDDALALARAVEFVDRATWEARYDVETPSWPDVSDLVDLTQPTDVTAETAPGTTAPSLVARAEVGPVGTDVTIGCGSVPPIDEAVEPPVVGTTPIDALAAFVPAAGLWTSGWIEQTDGDAPDATRRFEYRREDGLLVTVVYVEAVGDVWAVTRLLSTPC